MTPQCFHFLHFALIVFTTFVVHLLLIEMIIKHILATVEFTGNVNNAFSAHGLIEFTGNVLASV